MIFTFPTHESFFACSLWKVKQWSSLKRNGFKTSNQDESIADDDRPTIVDLHNGCWNPHPQWVNTLAVVHFDSGWWWTVDGDGVAAAYVAENHHMGSNPAWGGPSFLFPIQYQRTKQLKYPTIMTGCEEGRNRAATWIVDSLVVTVISINLLSKSRQLHKFKTPAHGTWTVCLLRLECGPSSKP